ncbi:hypothetical protein ACJJTC_003694 [Scirpophaga incertulas]
MEPAEFDATLGGKEHLPYSVNSLKFATARSVEIAAMTESILYPSKTKLIFQCLPVHMRRRVMSHNAKRLPRKLREGHLEQLKKSGLPPKQKRPTRRYRRRPENMLLEYNRRKQRNVWLETHIWHAKRFHMIERWGHRIAYAPCDKAFRACYRATSAHCLIQDISYYTPVSITGPENYIKEMFSSISSCCCGLSICAKAYIDGKREGFIHLYNKNSYPLGYIGKASFIWVNSKMEKSLWLFIHPSQIKQVESLLSDLLDTISPSECFEIPAKKKKIINKLAENIQIKVLPGAYNRFRLIGPKSHAVLTKSLKCIETIDQINHNKWISTIDKRSLYLKEKHCYWQNINNVMSPSQLPPRILVSLIVRDPRLSRPSKRTKAVNTSSVENVQHLIDLPPFLSISPIWDNKIHQILKNERLSNTEFIKHVTKTRLIPGELNINDPALQSIPVVLIQRPGSQNSNKKKIGYGCGWDIIVPSGYGLIFWHTFIMFGARSGGLRETENLAFEMGECYLPPDSKSGIEEEKLKSTELRERYFRLPPSKRINYRKLAVITPFTCPWNILLKDWSNKTSNEFFILRDRKLLSVIQDCMQEKKQLPEIDSSDICLVPIYLKMVKKGNIKQNAIICLPHEKDFLTLPNEPYCEDPNEKIRKEKRKAHLCELKSVKRRNKKSKVKNGTKVLSIKNKNSEPSEYMKQMRELWLPTNIETCRNSCSREVMGFLCQAAFSFSESCGCGVGYLAYNALDTLLKKNINQVLVRNVSSRYYRLANINVIKDQ